VDLNDEQPQVLLKVPMIYARTKKMSMKQKSLISKLLGYHYHLIYGTEF